MVKLTKWIKTWGALFVAIIALASSGFAIFIDNAHYQEITKPHTRHDEIYDRLTRLDNKIERIEQNINALQNTSLDTSGFQRILTKAKELCDQAELKWDAGYYTEADKLISEAHIALAQIALPPVPRNWWLMSGIIAGAIIIGIIWLVVRHKEKIAIGDNEAQRR